MGIPFNVNPMDRDADLRIKGHLYEIATIDDETIGNRQGFHAAETGYRKTFESVLDVSGIEMVDEVAEYIKDHIRSHEERPANQTVRKEARLRVSKAGDPPDEYLNAA